MDLKATNGKDSAIKRLKAQMRVYYGTTQQFLLSSSICNSVDLSSGGLFLQTETPLEVGEALLLRFTLPGEEKTMTCKAKVAWINEKENPRKTEWPTGVGVQFIDLSSQNLKELRTFIGQNEQELDV